MPYISKKRREELGDESSDGLDSLQNPGDLNYIFSVWLNEYVRQKGLSYQTINDIIGALESSKMEFYRRIAAPYENMKITLNGDVYDK